MGEHSDSAILEDFSGFRIDGLITTPQHLAQQSAIDALHPRAIAIANGYDLKPPPFCRHFGAIVCDNYKVGQTGAQFLAAKNYRHFAFVGMPTSQKWSTERQNGFVDELARCGHACQVFKVSSENSWELERKALTQFISSLPKPCAVMTAVDSRAKHVIDCCRLNGIVVPDQVGVLGVDNDDIICEWTQPSLSSIQPEFEDSGYRLAKMLDGLMAAKTTCQRIEQYGLTGIVERQSTTDIGGSVRLVSTARDFIRLHAAADITLADIASACGCSERALQTRFKKVLGTSPVAQLIESRLVLAADILRRTETPVDRVGEFCGFKTLSNLKASFKRKYGCTMSEWRRNSRA